MTALRTTMNGKPVFTVPAKTIINFKSGFGHKLLCDDMTFTAGSACVYSCSFCFVTAMMKKSEAWLQAQGVTGEHKDVVVRRSNAVEILRDQIRGKPFEFKNKVQVIYSSPLVDIAGNIELCNETVELVNAILKMTNWHVRLLSKSNMLPYIAEKLVALRNDARYRLIFGISTGTLDDKLTSVFEKGTPLVSKRIKSLHWLQDNKFRTFGMICPSLPQDDYFAFARAMADALRVDRCEHVWAEVINLRGQSFVDTMDALDKGCFHHEAQLLATVSNDKAAWELYARRTFEAHTVNIPANKLRFLQYLHNDNRAWWMARQALGVVPL